MWLFAWRHKSNNVLIIRQNSNIVPKIIDFGKSSIISSPCHSCIIVKNKKKFENAKLKYPHMAKELFFGKPTSIKTDIFAYGILLKGQWQRKVLLAISILLDDLTMKILSFPSRTF
jgi:serine/threonine protein kinase